MENCTFSSKPPVDHGLPCNPSITKCSSDALIHPFKRLSGPGRRSDCGRANILINPTGCSEGRSIDSLDKPRNRALDTEETTSRDRCPHHLQASRRYPMGKRLQKSLLFQPAVVVVCRWLLRVVGR
ncbi:hypothetical protein CEXT_742801 [Caerostris extrusa]|uniref:Uncharacterized protein n=1 Tax=Caerostris extrusa TaxID=172846 RepID=A0AAV4TBH4_CAEEX|nr:hypothetical protein CEXT_742801 [Caerostris extrusa]